MATKKKLKKAIKDILNLLISRDFTVLEIFGVLDAVKSIAMNVVRDKWLQIAREREKGKK